MDNRENQGGTMARRSPNSVSRPQGSQMAPYNPWREMDEMRRRMDDMFNRFFGFNFPTPSWTGDLAGMATAEAEPDVDIYENDNEYIIHAALPGMDPQNIHVEATDNSILLSAETRSPSGEGTQQGMQSPATQHRQSRYSSQSRFRFAYTLPTEIKANEVRANFRNGMLELHMPKLQPTQNKSVPINVQVEGTQGGTSLPSSSQTHEGAPSSKMGAAYTPSAGEDHTTQAQAAGEHQQRGTTTGQAQTPASQPVSSGTTKPT